MTRTNRKTRSSSRRQTPESQDQVRFEADAAEGVGSDSKRDSRPGQKRKRNPRRRKKKNRTVHHRVFETNLSESSSLEIDAADNQPVFVCADATDWEALLAGLAFERDSAETAIADPIAEVFFQNAVALDAGLKRNAVDLVWGVCEGELRHGNCIGAADAAETLTIAMPSNIGVNGEALNSGESSQTILSDATRLSGDLGYIIRTTEINVDDLDGKEPDLEWVGACLLDWIDALDEVMFPVSVGHFCARDTGVKATLLSEVFLFVSESVGFFSLKDCWARKLLSACDVVDSNPINGVVAGEWATFHLVVSIAKRIGNSVSENRDFKSSVLDCIVWLGNESSKTSDATAVRTILDESIMLEFNHREIVMMTPAFLGRKTKPTVPQLKVSFNASHDTPHLNQVVRYEAMIEHEPESNAAAHHLIFIDLLPNGMSLLSVKVAGAEIVFDGSHTGSVGLLLDELPVGADLRIEYEVRITSRPSAIGSTLKNDPFVEWTSSADKVIDGSKMERDGGGGNETANDQTVIATKSITIIHPRVELCHSMVQIASAASGIHGNLDVTQDLTITSTGNDPLTQVSLDEDLVSLLGDGFVGVVSGPFVTASTADDPLEMNPSYDGSVVNPSLINNSGGNTNRILQGESVTIRMTIEINPDKASVDLSGSEFVTQAEVSAVGEGSGVTTFDLSNGTSKAAGIETDAVADWEPDHASPKRCEVLTLMKDIIGDPVPASSGTQGNLDVTYQIVIEDDGETPMVGLNLVEDLVSEFGDAFVGFVGSPTMSSTAIDSPGIGDGISEGAMDSQPADPNIHPSQSNGTVTITFVVEVNPDAYSSSENASNSTRRLRPLSRPALPPEGVAV
jgi:hypothetical protein